MAKIITIDGLDGSGKTTQFHLLKDALQKAGYRVHSYHFPMYENDSSFFVRKFLNRELKEASNPYGVAIMYILDRYIYINTTDFLKIYNDNDDRSIILTDRYTSTTMLYQSAMLEEYTNEEPAVILDYIYDIEVRKLRIPKSDRVILLSVDPEYSYELLTQRSIDNNQPLDELEKDFSFQQKVYNNMKYIKDFYPTTIIDCMELIADQNYDVFYKIKSIEDIHHLILKDLRENLFIEV